MATQPLSKTERFLLNEVDSVPDKVVNPTILRHAARLTPRGFGTVLNRMIDRSLLGRTDEGKITLTFGGMQAMRAAGMEVQ